jgi:hypothetical protein
MATVAKCIITNSNEGRGAYGIRADNDEKVYFPFALTEAVELEEFEEVEAILVRNDRADPPWKSIRVRRLEEDN